LTIFNITSSVANPLSTRKYWEDGAEYLAYTPLAKAVGEPGFRDWKNPLLYEIAFYLEAGLKLDILEKFSGLPLIGNPKNLALIKKVK
jgi:hypothetical protein